jgi:hypothetical protein
MGERLFYMSSVKKTFFFCARGAGKYENRKINSPARCADFRGFASMPGGFQYHYRLK